jgi:hypothetical protein
MADIIKSVTRAYEFTNDFKIDYHLVEQGSPALITGIYETGTEITQNFYKKPDITGDDSTTKSAIIYGEVMITPYIVDFGVETSTNDPSSVLKTVRFHMGDGEQQGIVPGPTGSNLENVYLIRPNKVPQPVIDSDGRPTTGDVILAATLGGVITSAPKIWDAIKASTPPASKVSNIDPVTGKAIPTAKEKDAATVQNAITLDGLSDVNAAGKGTNFVPTWDPTTSKWVAKSPNQILTGIFTDGQVCGGAGGQGGTGGTGGQGGGSTSGTIDTTYGVSIISVAGSGSPTSFTPNASLAAGGDYGFTDVNYVQHVVGNLGGAQIGSSAGTIAVGYQNYFNTPYVTVSMNPGHSVSIKSFNDVTKCEGLLYLNAWIKKIDGTLATNPYAAAGVTCLPCFVGNPDEQLRSVKAASTANISATSAIVDKTPTPPSLIAHFDLVTPPPSLGGSGTLEGKFSSVEVVSGGGVFYTNPYNKKFSIYYFNSSVPQSLSTLVPTLSNTTYGSITAVTHNPAVTKPFVQADWAIQRWLAGCWNGTEYLVIGVKPSTGALVTIKSTDRITWTQGATSFPFNLNTTSIPFGDVTFGNSIYCAVFTNGNIATSPDGITWTQRTASPTGTWRRVAWNGNVFCAIDSYNGIISTSPDGITWTQRTSPFFSYRDIVWNGTVFCVVGYFASGTIRCLTSPDGIIWTPHTMPVTGGTSAVDGYQSITSNNTGRLVASVSHTYNTFYDFAYSVDNGSTWTPSSRAFNDYPYTNLTWDGTNFVAYGRDFTTGAGGESVSYAPYSYSPDGVTWTEGVIQNLSSTIFRPIINGSSYVSFLSHETLTDPATGSHVSLPFTSSNGIDWTINSMIGSGPSEVIPFGYGYDPVADPQHYHEIPKKTRRLTTSISTLDGAAVAAGDLVLLKDQTDKTQNGIYEVINSSTLDLIYELTLPKWFSNGVWTQVTAGSTNINTKWMLNTPNHPVMTLTDPMVWADITSAQWCSYTVTAPGEPAGPGGPGQPGQPGGPGQPGNCVTISTVSLPQPTISLVDPCAKVYGPAVGGVFPLVVFPPALTLFAGTTPTNVTLVYSITQGEGTFSVAAAIGGVTVTVGDRKLTLTGSESSVKTATNEVRLQVPSDSRGEIKYQVLVTNNENQSASVTCSVMPTVLEELNSSGACASITITAAPPGSTAKLRVNDTGVIKDLTNGFVPFSIGIDQTAVNIAANINTNVGVKHALQVTDPGWLPLYVATASLGTITVCAPAAGGADFNNIKLESVVTGGFTFGSPGTFLGGITKNVSDFLNRIPNWDKISDVLVGVAGQVAGAVITNIIMNKSSSLQISIPNEDDISVAFLYRGRKVQVPTEYDGLARTGHPTYVAWSHTWKSAYTNNPAWVVYDYIKNKKFGWGVDLPLTAAQEDLLIQDLFDVAILSDERVTDINGVLQPRFSCNTVIVDGTRRQILEQLCSVFYGAYSFWCGGIRVTADKPDTTIRLLVNQANSSGVTEQLTSSQTFTNKVRLSYVEPSNFYNAEVVVAENTEAIKDWGEKAIDLESFGCTNASEAFRKARWILATQFDNSRIISYTGSLDHYALVPGQIVQYEDPLERGSRYSGRAISATGTTVILDAPIAAVAGNSFSITNQDGTIHQTTISSVTGTTLIMAAPSAGVIVPYATFIAADSVIGKQLYKVIKVDENSLGSYNVTLQYYSPNKFVAITE